MTNVILSFHDCIIKQSDINILDGPEWLNDRLISFFFQYLENVKYKTKMKDVCFVDPEVCQCIKLTNGSDVNVFVEPHHLGEKNLILLAVNDCQEEEAAGGSHWSLLVYVRPTNEFYHYDSFGGANIKHAHEMMQHLLPYVKCTSPPMLVSAACLQQENTYDCGIHVICNTELVCKKYLDGGDENCDYLTREIVAGKRKWLKNLILSLC